MSIKALLFDLDGVLVDTAKYHFLAWKQLADRLGIPFTLQDNERFKGVSRDRCMELLLELGGRAMSREEMAAFSSQKNNIYIHYIQNMGEEELLPGAKDFLQEAKNQGYAIALGSASKNSMLILERLHLTAYFDAIIDGTRVTRAKPDPQVFILGAQTLGVSPQECVVFEDSVAGIEAAHAGGMKAVGIGTPQTLPQADLHLPGFSGITIDGVIAALKHRQS